MLCAGTQDMAQEHEETLMCLEASGLRLSRGVSIYSCMEKPNIPSLPLSWPLSCVTSQGGRQSCPIQQRAAQTCTELLAAITWALPAAAPSQTIFVPLWHSRQAAGASLCPGVSTLPTMAGSEKEPWLGGETPPMSHRVGKMSPELICFFLCALSAPNLSGK